MTHYLADIPSPPQGVWHVGPVPLRAYALCIIAGIIIAVIWGGRRYVARGGRPGRIADLAVWGVPFGLVGGRAYHVITDHELYFGPGRNPWKAFAIWDGGLGIWGAIALGALGFWLGCRHYKIPMAPVADALAPAIVLAQAIGRLGNYFNQELFGAHTTLPWALQVFVRTPGGVAYAGSAADAANIANCEFPTDYIKAVPEVLCGAGTYHPTFLYELIWDLLVVALIVWADRKFRLGGGRVFALYVAGYTAGRGWIEALRIDPARTHIFGLRVNIVVSIVVFLLAVAYLIWRRKAAREDPVVVAGPDPDGSTGGSDPKQDSVAGSETDPDDDRPVQDSSVDDNPGDVTRGDDSPGDIEPGDIEPGDIEPGDIEPGDIEPGDIEPGDVSRGDETLGNATLGAEPASADPAVTGPAGDLSTPVDTIEDFPDGSPPETSPERRIGD